MQMQGITHAAHTSTSTHEKSCRRHRLKHCAQTISCQVPTSWNQIYRTSRGSADGGCLISDVPVFATLAQPACVKRPHVWRLKQQNGGKLSSAANTMFMWASVTVDCVHRWSPLPSRQQVTPLNYWNRSVSRRRATSECVFVCNCLRLYWNPQFRLPAQSSEAPNGCSL